MINTVDRSGTPIFLSNRFHNVVIEYFVTRTLKSHDWRWSACDRIEHPNGEIRTNESETWIACSKHVQFLDLEFETLAAAVEWVEAGAKPLVVAEVVNVPIDTVKLDEADKLLKGF